MTTYDFRAVSAVGVVIATFGSLDQAKAFARENVETFPGLRIEAVTTTVNVQTVYRPRTHLRAVA